MNIPFSFYKKNSTNAVQRCLDVMMTIDHNGQLMNICNIQEKQMIFIRQFWFVAVVVFITKYIEHRNEYMYLVRERIIMFLTINIDLIIIIRRRFFYFFNINQQNDEITYLQTCLL